MAWPSPILLLVFLAATGGSRLRVIAQLYLGPLSVGGGAHVRRSKPQ